MLIMDLWGMTFHAVVVIALVLALFFQFQRAMISALLFNFSLVAFIVSDRNFVRDKMCSEITPHSLSN